MTDSPSPHVLGLQFVKAAFERSANCLDESDSAFAPSDGMFTAAQQVAHTAFCLDWFLEGAFRPEGFDLDFEAQEKRIRAVTSLTEARAWWERSWAQVFETLGAATDEELAVPIADGPIMGGAPRSMIINGISDHTTHHRGALTVYSRLRGKVPVMPYE